MAATPHTGERLQRFLSRFPGDSLHVPTRGVDRLQILATRCNCRFFLLLAALEECHLDDPSAPSTCLVYHPIGDDGLRQFEYISETGRTCTRQTTDASQAPFMRVANRMLGRVREWQGEKRAKFEEEALEEKREEGGEEESKNKGH